MKRVAYIISKNGSGEFIQESILAAIAEGVHGGEVVAIYFTEEGVYHLVKGARRAKEIGIAMESQGVRVFASKQSVKDRKLQNMIIPGIELSGYDTFFEIAQEVDHLISV